MDIVAPKLRKPRYRRDRRVRRRIELTSRDLVIFELLMRYRYLRSNFTWELVRQRTGCRKKGAFLDRLSDLFQNGYIDLPRQQLQYANARYMPNIHALDRRGTEALSRHGLWTPEIVSLYAAKHATPGRQFAHRLMISDVLASIEVALHGRDDIRLVDFHEIAASLPAGANLGKRPMALPATIRLGGETRQVDCEPDALFGLEYRQPDGQTLHRFFALEVDRGTEPVSCRHLGRSSFLQKALAYRDIAARKTYARQFGLPNLMVLVVTMSNRRMETMAGTLAAETGGASPMFAFRTMDTLGASAIAPSPDSTILSSPWTRAGSDPFFVDRAPNL